MKNNIILMAHSLSIWLYIVICPLILFGLIYLLSKKDYRSKAGKLFSSMNPFSKGEKKKDGDHDDDHPKEPTPAEKNAAARTHLFWSSVIIIGVIFAAIILLRGYAPVIADNIQHKSDKTFGTHFTDEAQEAYAEQFKPKSVLVTESGFPLKIRSSEHLHWEITGTEYTISVSDPDGSNTSVYTQDDQHVQIDGDHMIVFKTKKGVTAKLTYKVTTR